MTKSLKVRDCFTNITKAYNGLCHKLKGVSYIMSEVIVLLTAIRAAPRIA